MNPTSRPALSRRHHLEGLAMKAWIGAALLAAALTLGAPAATPARAMQPEVAHRADGATEFSARRRHQRVHRHYRQRHVYAPVYYARPYHYRPYRGVAPFFPFGFGYGLDPSW
jgi:hypothetical protein